MSGGSLMTRANGITAVSGGECNSKGPDLKSIDIFPQVLNQQLDFCRCELP
jgi:hypothetical protein